MGKIRNYGLLCMCKYIEGDMLKYYIAAHKGLKIKARDIIDIFNNSPEIPKKEYSVFQILYTPLSDGCQGYYYLKEIDVDPNKIKWDEKLILEVLDNV